MQVFVLMQLKLYSSLHSNNGEVIPNGASVEPVSFYCLQNYTCIFVRSSLFVGVSLIVNLFVSQLLRSRAHCLCDVPNIVFFYPCINFNFFIDFFVQY